MEKITLEKVDMVRERTKVTYAEAKEALEACDGDVLEALIYIETHSKNNNTTDNYYNTFKNEGKNILSIEELKTWLKDLIAKGNVTRIKIKKDDDELVDIPVNAGIAAGIIAVVIPPILAAGVIAAIATKITIEITREDGSVEVINKYVSKVTNEVKAKATDLASKMKSKVNEVKEDNIWNKDNVKVDNNLDNESVYSYTVTFDDEEEEKKDDSQDENKMNL